VGTVIIKQYSILTIGSRVLENLNQNPIKPEPKPDLLFFGIGFGIGIRFSWFIWNWIWEF
jgi:hypothetical protein